MVLSRWFYGLGELPSSVGLASSVRAGISDGPVSIHGREAGFLFHSSEVASPIPETPDSQSLRWRRALIVCSFYAPHVGIASDTRIEFLRTLAASSPSCLAVPLEPSQQSQPIVVVPLWTSFSLRLLSQVASLSTLFPITVDLPLCCPLFSSDHMLCSGHLDIPHASLLLHSAHSSLPRVRDWSNVVAACHHNLSVWHQSVLAHVSGPSLTFMRVLPLWTFFDSPTRIVFDCASLHKLRSQSLKFSFRAETSTITRIEVGVPPQTHPTTTPEPGEKIKVEFPHRK